MARTRRSLLSATAGVATFAGCTDFADLGGSVDSQGNGSLEPGGAHTTDGPESSGPSAQTVSFAAPTGSDVTATRYGDGDCGVVLVPQINQDRESWRHQAEWLAANGYLALAIDEDPDHRAGSVRGAVDVLHNDQGVTSVVLIGGSSGGEAVVRAAVAAPDGSVAGLVTQSAGGGAAVADHLRAPSVFVVASGDAERFVRMAHELHENAPEPTYLVTYEGAAHGQALFETHGRDLRQRLQALLSRGCSSATTSGWGVARTRQRPLAPSVHGEGLPLSAPRQ